MPDLTPQQHGPAPPTGRTEPYTDTGPDSRTDSPDTETDTPLASPDNALRE
ncbi:hypothetical protein PH213_20585 [Streptomyces sp. SRF1]|uniref:hypothetical protein n=1 Tax=Streptomyces sp. SRF1 TaxID=1549642 RepID=UPI0025B061A8|nr:hypothetical protein [Streptomyces sp. SRF1]MDN3056904.1 hypothetical protein [Streptomyces sp. SRF1]